MNPALADTWLCEIHREAPAPSPPPPPSSQSPATPTPARDARLAAIRLTDGAASGGTPVTLSSAFRPTVTTYGAVVSAETAVATLCLQVLSLICSPVSGILR